MPTGAQNRESQYRNMLFAVDGLSAEIGTATAVSGAATLNDFMGSVTTEVLSTAAGATYALTITNPSIGANDNVFVTLRNGTNTTGQPAVATTTPAAGSVVIVVQNIASAAALNGTLRVGLMVVKQLL